ncbi:hypothetical protein LOTGIDRAFT_158705 [Lottia gigantea]|uniref:Uncharacterized protein n=1 Tax=Lottia gigantea TaxID=225164 RepID=V4CAC9_LOTGI|nr:hypothetical protein LOTGIDRAFT_158705 [Lottia gigantea]ESO98759.1 hypothetical protein LOTGIDRAFT_158705 [Lottia gigantea]
MSIDFENRSSDGKLFHKTGSLDLKIRLVVCWRFFVYGFVAGAISAAPPAVASAAAIPANMKDTTKGILDTIRAEVRDEIKALAEISNSINGKYEHVLEQNEMLREEIKVVKNENGDSKRLVCENSCQ